MPIRIAVAALASALVLAPLPLANAASPQAVNPAQPRSQASLAVGNSLQQVSIAIAHLRRTLDAINVPKWKAPGDIRRTTASDVDSMQRDITDTLPALINTALGDPAKISPAFAVYRNVDALYDVLLRVSETAQLAGAARDADALEEQRSMLENSRSQLGAALLQSSQAQDTEVVRLRTAVVAAAPPPQPTKTVVDDGPVTKSKTRKRTTHKPAPPPANPQQ
ncbi:MAG TPA: hypothetical protein VFE22_02310 [Edaphobacter sp.]|nr:hypothetical protein [Edaphobacter sp.]